MVIRVFTQSLPSALNVVLGASKVWSLSDQQGQAARSGFAGSAALDLKAGLGRVSTTVGVVVALGVNSKLRRGPSVPEDP
jgi:hypothetical protein